jgi:4-hydroxymandelate oxidase
MHPQDLDGDDVNVTRHSDRSSQNDLGRVLNLKDFEGLARLSMTPEAFDYCAGGAADESTLHDNVTAFSRWKLRPRVLVDVSSIDMTTEMLGSRVAMPVALAPTALQRLAHAEAEMATARAAAEAGVAFCLSTLGSCTIEEVARAARRPSWFQLYVLRDRGVSKSLIERAEAAGFDALVVTVDLPVVGYRERDLRNRFEVAPKMYGNLVVPAAEGREFHEVVSFVSDPALTWEDLAWVRGVTSLPLVVKGVLTGEDAELAVEHGAHGLVVSNHGGRQLDRTIAPIDALEDVAQRVAGRAEVYLDGGVRRGTDVVTALALGARAVFIGRPYLFALAAAGQPGVERALELIARELGNAMALLGARTVRAITRAHVVRM